MEEESKPGVRELAGRSDKGNRVQRHRGYVSEVRACWKVQSKGEAEIGCGSRGASGPEHPGPEVCQGFT